MDNVLIKIHLGIVDKTSDENPHIKECITNCETAPKSDKDMAKMIRLPKDK
jgi:hypothetical protein